MEGASDGFRTGGRDSADGANLGGEGSVVDGDLAPGDAARPHGGKRAHDPVTVITEAQPSYDEAFRARRKRYIIMMAMRLPCLILAVILYQTPWLALLIILISIPLPWMAVLIANDGPARKQRAVPRGVANQQPMLAAAPYDVVDDEHPN